jgi:exonuclease III
MKIRAMSYNIEYGGLSIYKKTGNMNYVNKYIDLIKSYKIDIVSFQECKLRDIDISKIIAEKLGYYHKYFFDKTDYYKNKYYHQSIISKFPIVYTDEEMNMCRVNIKGTLVNIVNVHLDDEPYIPYSLKGIKYPNTPLNITNISDAVDLSFATKRDVVQNIMNNKNIINSPTIIMGDFNEPSHLDYKYIKWKTSKYIMNRGFIDAARYLYKNAVKYPLHTVDLYDKGFSPERIDIMYCNNGLKPVKFTNIYNKMSDHIPIVGVFEIVGRANIMSANISNANISNASIIGASLKISRTKKSDTKKSNTKKQRKTNNNTKKVSKL